MVELVYKFDEKSTEIVEKVSRPLKYHSNFFWEYIKGHQPRSHNPLLAHAHAG